MTRGLTRARLALGLAAIAIIAVGLEVTVGSFLGRAGEANTLVAPPDDLASPYDFAGVRDALAARGTILSLPTTDEAKGVRISPDAFLAHLPATVAESYPGERAQVVAVHLAVVDMNDPHITITHRLSYVVETTGHATGNCFTLYDASAGGQYLAACFYGERSRPRADQSRQR